MSKKNELIKKINERSIYADYRDDKEYYERNKIKQSFVGLPHSLLMNGNFLRLSDKAQLLYIYMTDYANGEIYFTFPHSVYSKLMCNEAFRKMKKELITYGFIEEVENGKFTRTENKYKFIGKWKDTKREEKKKRKLNPNFKPKTNINT